MIKVENIAVWGFEAAIRGMRNPMNSWDKSDSFHYDDPIYYFEVGENDLDLMRRLYKSGTEHRTYARMIQVSVDITAPLYWWKEMDRYTVGKSQVSCSTMHKIAAKGFELDDFSHEHLCEGKEEVLVDAHIPSECCYSIVSTAQVLNHVISALNACREKYIDTKDKKYWWQLIQLLPSSYNQRRTVCMSYETVFKIIKERTGHKLDEWVDFVEILKDLPYVEEIICD